MGPVALVSPSRQVAHSPVSAAPGKLCWRPELVRGCGGNPCCHFYSHKNDANGPADKLLGKAQREVGCSQDCHTLGGQLDTLSLTTGHEQQHHSDLWPVSCTGA